MANESTGKNAVLTFGATPYAALTQLSINGQGSEITEEVSSDGTGAATILKQVGAQNWRVSGTLKIPTNAATIPNAFDLNTSGAVKAYPAGDETGSIEYAWTTGQVMVHNVDTSPSMFVALAVEVTCTGEPVIGTKTA